MYSFSDSFDGYDPANYAQGTPVPAPDEDFERAWGMWAEETYDPDM